MSTAMADKPKTDERTRMYFRIDRRTRIRFKALAQLNGETTEGRLGRIMREDIERHLPGSAAAAS